MNLALSAFLVGLALYQSVGAAEASTDTIGLCGGRLVDELFKICANYGNVRKRSDAYLTMPWKHRWTRDAKSTCKSRLETLRCMCCRSAYGPCSYEELVVYHCENPPRDMLERVLKMNAGRG